MNKRWISCKLKGYCIKSYILQRNAHTRIRVIAQGDKSVLRTESMVNTSADRERKRGPLIFEKDGKFNIDFHGFTPLELFRGNVLRVTDISIPYCELEKLFRLGRGDVLKTVQMTQGSQIHENWEKEADADLIGETASINVTELKTKEDRFALKLCDQLVKFSTIRTTGARVREIYVYGTINGHPVTGYIDELSLDSNGAIMIREMKTRNKKSMPEITQLLSAYHQVLVYHKLLQNMVNEPTDCFKEFYEIMGIDSKLPFSQPLQDIIGYTCIDDIHNEFQQLLPLSNELIVEYLYQKSGDIIGQAQYFYDEETFQMLIDYTFSFWKAKRSPFGIDPTCMNICKYCPYINKCQWYLDLQNEPLTV